MRGEVIFSGGIDWVARWLAARPTAPALAQATVLVPSERHAHAIRRRLCHELGRPDHVAGVHLRRPIDLAADILLLAGHEVVANVAEQRTLRLHALFESADLPLAYFEMRQLRSGHGYVAAFAHAIAELEASGVRPPMLERIATTMQSTGPGAAARLTDLATVWRRANGGSDSSDTPTSILMAAAACLRDAPHLAERFAPFCVLLVSSPTVALLEFLAALPDVDLAFVDARPMRTNTQRWRAAVDWTQPRTPTTASAESELKLVQRYLFELPEVLTDPQRQRSNGPDGTVDLEEYASVEEEIEAAALWVIEQIHAGVPLQEIAVVTPDTDAYAGRLADRLTRLAPTPVPVCIAGGQRLAQLPAGMRMRVVLEPLHQGLDAATTKRLLPALRRGKSDDPRALLRLSPTRAAEIVFSTGIAGGAHAPHEWGERFRNRLQAVRQRLADDDTSGSKRNHLIRRQDAERWLRDVEPVLPAIAAFEAVATAVEREEPLSTLWPLVRDFLKQWLRIPAEPANAVALLDEVLAPLAAESAAQQIRGRHAIELIGQTIDRTRFQAVRFGEPAIFVGAATDAAGLPFRRVRCLGLVEGGWPQTPHDDPIIADSLRVMIEAGAAGEGVIVPRLADKVLEELHLIGRIIADTAEAVSFSLPRQWVDRSEREVSGILLEVATALGRPSVDGSREGDVPAAAQLRSSYLTLGRLARQQTARAAALTPRSCLALPRRCSDGSLLVPNAWIDAASTSIERTRALLAGVASETWGVVDGDLGGASAVLVAPGLSVQHPTSASALNLLLTCPHRFLLERILHWKAPGYAPPTDMIEPADYGTLFHAAAEVLYGEGGSEICRGVNVEHWRRRAAEIGNHLLDEFLATYPLRGVDTIARERQRLASHLQALVRFEAAGPPRQFLAAELRFGEPEAVALDAEGDPIFVRGAIDRVDRLDDVGLIVRDLKTGRLTDRSERPDAARDLQIGVYTLVLDTLGYGDVPVAIAGYLHPSPAGIVERQFNGSYADVLRKWTRAWLRVARGILAEAKFPRTSNPDDCRFCPFVPVCGEGAQERSKAKLTRVAHTDVLHPFARFKQWQVDRGA